MAHQHPLKVRFYELDPYNHANHSVYIQYFEVGRIELLQEIGFGLDVLVDMGVRLVVTGIETRFLMPIGPRDTVVIETVVGKLGRATARWHQRMLRGDDVVARQAVSFAATDVEGTPVRFPAELVAAMEELHEPQD